MILCQNKVELVISVKKWPTLPIIDYVLIVYSYHARQVVVCVSRVSPIRVCVYDLWVCFASLCVFSTISSLSDNYIQFWSANNPHA